MMVFAYILVVLGLVAAALAIKVVPQGKNFTVERFGKYIRTLEPGLHFIVPLVDVIGRKMNMMETVLDVPTQEVITKDNAMVSTDAVVFIQIMEAVKAAYEVTNLELAIQNLALTNVRTVVGAMDLDEVLSRRDEINARLLSVIDSATIPWGVKVTRIEIKDLQPPANILEAMGKQMIAERAKRAEILQAEGMKSAAVLKAEGEKEAAIREAEGRREAAFLDAEAREREAEAEAKATEMVSKAISGGSVAAINYFLGQRYVDAFEKLASANQQRVVILPAEFSGLASTLGGIGEIARSTFASRPDETPPSGTSPRDPQRPSSTPWTA